MAKKTILFHADDYGANREVSAHILDCYREGALNSLSVLPNGDCLDECMRMLEPYREQVNISIHFNLAEGHCLADPAQVPWLVDERGMFRISFLKVLLLSFGRKRKELKRQIKAEMKAQLARMLPYVDTVRVDSHQHYHMIPVVLAGILEAVREARADKNGKPPEIAFIRIPVEPLAPYLKHPELYAVYKPINMIKQFVLYMLKVMDSGLLKPYRKKSAVFFGLLLTSGMSLERVCALLPDFRKVARKKGLPLEVLCHPGGAKRAEDLMDPHNQECADFYTSDNRKMEKDMLMRIGKER